jgi:chromosome partitioning protein
MLRFQQSSASFRTTAMGPAAQIYGIVFNSIKANTDIEVPKMRMQLRLNQFKTQKRGCAPTAKICTTQIRDAMIVRRAVTLGLPVFLVGSEGNEEDSVASDYLKLANEIIENAPPA